MVLPLLDLEEFQAAQIEAMVAALHAPAPKATEPAARQPSPPIRVLSRGASPLPLLRGRGLGEGAPPHTTRRPRPHPPPA
jgi:hypothetical protein